MRWLPRRVQVTSRDGRRVLLDGPEARSAAPV